jgi:aminoglycoside 3-N-acetyltransferase
MAHLVTHGTDRWVDIRRSRLRDTLPARHDLAVRTGCVGVEFDDNAVDRSSSDQTERCVRRSMALPYCRGVTELDAIQRTARPATVASLVGDLRSIGLTDGMTVMVHSSLSALGFVVGGAQSVVEALTKTVGPRGTVMMPTHSGGLSDPSSWSNPPVPEHWWEVLRAEMPAFDPHLTPTRMMGAVVDCFRHLDGTKRSAHPTVSASARGPNAAFLVEGHELSHGLGESSPQARLYDLDGSILLLGVTHANNTSLHLAEYRSAALDADEVTCSSPIEVNGERQWVSYLNLDDDDSDFERLGDDFARADGEVVGSVGAGTGRLMSFRQVVDYAVGWMRSNR